MRLSIELVPREKDSLIAKLELIKSQFPIVDVINIPDLLKYNIRSWEACSYVKQYYNHSIPHIRAIDINLNEHLKMAEEINRIGIHEILVVSGDSPQEITKKVYPTTSIDAIKKFKRELPNIRVYAAIDQYRTSFKKEMDYINMKVDAGADGFFFQPFYDLRLLEIYAEKMTTSNSFYGISPVLSEQSINYWQIKNNVVFPAKFQPTLEWNINFGRQVVDFVREGNGNLYLMPIKVDLLTYLYNLLNGI